MHYTSHKISDAEIAAAVAQAIIHDIHVNLLGLEGFPAIEVKQGPTGNFAVELQWKDYAYSFEMTSEEAKQAVKAMKGSAGVYHQPIFERTQQALANLEGNYINRRR